MRRPTWAGSTPRSNAPSPKRNEARRHRGSPATFPRPPAAAGPVERGEEASGAGLVYVGAVRCINGVMLLGWLTPKEAGPLTLLVGALPVCSPTDLIAAAAGNEEDTAAAASIDPVG